LLEAAGRKSPMETFKIKREIVTVVMKSSLYFTIPLQRRLEFIKFFSQQPVLNAVVDPQIGQAARKDYLKQPDLIRALDNFSIVSVGGDRWFRIAQKSH
jgi:hypothetical protein